MKKVILILAIMILTNPIAVSAAEEPRLVLGPYSGAVIDGQTRAPIEGAVVLFYWVMGIPQVLLVDKVPRVIGTKLVLARSELIYTDAKGNYGIRPFSAEQSGLLESVHVIIYQRGYKAYLREIQYHNSYYKPDPNFKELDNYVVLERIPPDFDYDKHYAAIEAALSGLESIKHTNAADEQSQDHLQPDDIDQKAILNRAEVLRRAEWERVRGKADRRYQ